MAELQVKDLKNGMLLKGDELTLTVETLNTSANPKGPWGYGLLGDATGKIRVSYWDEPTFEQGDSVKFSNVWRVSEWNGNLELQLGKYYESSVVGSAASESAGDLGDYY